MTDKLPHNPHKFSDFITTTTPHWLTTFALARGMTETARLFRGGRAVFVTPASRLLRIRQRRITHMQTPAYEIDEFLRKLRLLMQEHSIHSIGWGCHPHSDLHGVTDAYMFVRHDSRGDHRVCYGYDFDRYDLPATDLIGGRVEIDPEDRV